MTLLLLAIAAFLALLVVGGVIADRIPERDWWLP
jgi:hypothetical protein